MNKKFSEELISAYLDGELTSQEQAQVEHALAEDAQRRQMLEELGTLQNTLQSLPRRRLPEDFSQQVLRRAERTMLSQGASPAAPSADADASKSSQPDHALRTGNVAANQQQATKERAEIEAANEQPAESPLADDRPPDKVHKLQPPRASRTWRVVISAAAVAASVLIMLSLFPGERDAVVQHSPRADTEASSEQPEDGGFPNATRAPNADRPPDSGAREALARREETRVLRDEAEPPVADSPADEPALSPLAQHEMADDPAAADERPSALADRLAPDPSDGRDHEPAMDEGRRPFARNGFADRAELRPGAAPRPASRLAAGLQDDRVLVVQLDATRDALRERAFDRTMDKHHIVFDEPVQEPDSDAQTAPLTPPQDFAKSTDEAQLREQAATRQSRPTAARDVELVFVEATLEQIEAALLDLDYQREQFLAIAVEGETIRDARQSLRGLARGDDPVRADALQRRIAGETARPERARAARAESFFTPELEKAQPRQAEQEQRERHEHALDHAEPFAAEPPMPRRKPADVPQAPAESRQRGYARYVPLPSLDDGPAPAYRAAPDERVEEALADDAPADPDERESYGLALRRAIRADAALAPAEADQERDDLRRKVRVLFVIQAVDPQEAAGAAADAAAEQ